MPDNTEEPGSIPFLPEVKRSPRVTFRVDLYHSIPGSQPSGIEPIRSSRWIDSEEQGYSRSIKVEQAWKAVEIGWLAEIGASFIAIQNATKRLPGKNPTEQEVQDLRDTIVEYGIKYNDEVVPIGYLQPEEGTFLSLIDSNSLMVRCRKGIAKVTYLATPN